MASCPVIKFTKKYTITLIIGFCFALPLIIVHVYPTDSPQTYVFEGRVIEKLGETLEGKLRYYQVKLIQGNVPAEEFVITVDDSYTRGGQSPDYVGYFVWLTSYFTSCSTNIIDELLGGCPDPQFTYIRIQINFNRCDRLLYG